MSSRTTKQPSLSQDAVLRKLQEVVKDENLNGIRANLDYIKEHYPILEDDTKVKYAAEVMEKLEDRRKNDALEKLRQAVIQKSEKAIRRALAHIGENFPELREDTEVEDAESELQRLEAINTKTMNTLLQAMFLRDEKAIRQQVQYIRDEHPHLSRTRAFKDAEKSLKTLDSDRDKFNQKMALERLRQAKLRQDEEKLAKELKELKHIFSQPEKLPEVVEAEEWLRILRAAKRLRECCKSRDKNDIDDALKEIKSNKIPQEPLRFLILEAKYILKELNRARRSSPIKIDQASLNEVRRYITPPPGVLPVMQAVFLLLGKDESETKTWQQIQKLWKPTGPWNPTAPKRPDGRKVEQQSLYSEIVNFDVFDVDPTIAARAREIILGERELIVDQPEEHTDADDVNRPSTGYGEADAGYRTDRTAKNTDELRAETSTTREASRKYAETDDGGDGGEINPDDVNSTQEEVPEVITTVRMKKQGVHRSQLRKSCPVANALLVWVLEVALQVEDREGSAAMVPLRDVRQQKRYFGTFLPTIPTTMDRGYYRDLAQASVRRGQLQQQKPQPPVRKPYGRNSDGKPFRYYQQVNHDLPRLVQPLSPQQQPYEPYWWPTTVHGNASYMKRQQQHYGNNNGRPRYDYTRYNDDDEQAY